MIFKHLALGHYIPYVERETGRDYLVDGYCLTL